MIQFPTTNLFDAKPPILEDGEEEVFFQHPIFDIKCNQLGVLHLNEDKYYAVYSVYGIYVRSRVDEGNLKYKDNLGMKQKIVWECYEGRRLESGKQFHHINSNPLDFSVDNLIPTTHKDRKLIQTVVVKKKKFIKTSIEELIKLEAKYEKRGMQKEQLYEVLMLPMWLINARKKWDDLSPKKRERKYIPTGKTSKITPEEEKKIVHYFDEGLTYKEIVLRMGYKSKTPIRRILYKWGRRRKK